ncbi:MAG: UUP1 family membrane protein, partial [Desulfobacterota bacterium]|nr:UUP1 family membrane protein [Thermodesulfobacteriota bacterium]
MSFTFKKTHSHFLTAFLFIAFFLIIAGYKIIFLHYPILPKPVENVWTWELKIQFHNKKEKNLIQHFLPKTEVGQNIIREDFISPKFYFFIGKSDSNLSIQWRGKGIEGENHLFYRVTVQIAPRKFSLDSDRVESASYPSPVARYLGVKDEPESVTLEMRQFLDDLIKKGDSKLVIAKKIFNFITKEIRTVSFAKDQNLINPLRNRIATLAQKKKLFIQLARLAGIPARSVHGAFLDEGIRHKSLYSWIEVFLYGKWIPIDVEKNLFGKLPENLLILYRGNYLFINSTTVDRLEYSYSALKENQVTFSHFYETSPLIGSILHEWSLFSCLLYTSP